MNPADVSMTDSPNASHHPWPAPCRGARRLLILVMVVVGLFIAPIAADLTGRRHKGSHPAGVWIRALALSAPALGTAGSPLRHPEMVHPGVDLRFAVGLEVPP